MQSLVLVDVIEAKGVDVTTNGTMEEGKCNLGPVDQDI
jgi:hypothetical protein